MPARVAIDSLLNLSLNAVCKNMNELMTFASLFLWRSNYDTFLETGKKIDEVIPSGREHMSFGYGVDERNDTLEQQGNFHCVISGYIQNLPPVFHNEIFNRLLSQLTFMQVDEGQIEAFLRDRRSCINRVRFHFTLILNSMLTSKVSVMNVNPISMYLHSALAKYLIDNKDSIDDETVERLEEKSMNIFLPAIVKFENSFESLTTLSLQNMANGPLMWMISLECPNLWHLDVSGEHFDLALHQASKTNSGECGAVDKKGRRHKERAEFLNSLCSLYGNDNQWHEKYGKVNGCFVLKSLLLPKLKWEREEELQLIRETIQIIQKLTELEELMGVNLLNSFSTLNRLPYPPFMLKLKKFSNQPGEIFFDVEPELLRKVHLPLVTEVEFVINLPIPLTILEIFPNMRHLSLTPYSYDSHNFNDIAKYLTNLQTLNLEVLHELSVESVCELAEHCPNLESLYLTCPSLRTALQEHACEKTKNKWTEEDSQPPGTKIDQSKGAICEPQEASDVLKNISNYRDNLVNILDASEYDDTFVPKLQKLQALSLYFIESVDVEALVKCVKGCPNLSTLIVGVYEWDSNSYKGFNDDLVGRMVCRLKYLENFILRTLSDSEIKYQFKDVTVMSVKHILNFCRNIQNIGNAINWNIPAKEVESLNENFKANNFVLRLK